ncbi:hypothetical protein RUM4293_04448 [Ruegeria atlantica]|uniref:Integrase n=1 Tax=Ruegeria atlantica TaxID=81569 RepID=A0A0N7LPL2_9RHOB|nr:hypothetical protein RUM4293_04448 [Ruegeria atlantica]
MSKIQLPTVRPKRGPWNKGRLVGQKRPLLPKQVWAIRARLELAGNFRDLAMFNLAIDSNPSGLSSHLKSFDKENTNAQSYCNA